MLSAAVKGDLREEQSEAEARASSARMLMPTQEFKHCSAHAHPRPHFGKCLGVRGASIYSKWVPEWGIPELRGYRWQLSPVLRDHPSLSLCCSS